MNPTLARMEHLRRLILLHSYIYYKEATSLVTDAAYDAWGKELAHLNKTHPHLTTQGQHAQAFTNWDGVTLTGFNLPYSHPDTAAWAARIHRNLQTEIQRRNNEAG